MPMPEIDMKGYGMMVTIPFFIVPLIIILSTYAVIFRIASAHARGRGVRSFKKVRSNTPARLLNSTLIILQLVNNSDNDDGDDDD